MRVERNIVLTGLGHSGTTLACHLLNKVPDTVALSEPMAPAKFEGIMPDRGAVCESTEKFFRRMRRMALRQGEVVSKHLGGIVPDNQKAVVDGVRRRVVEKGRISVGKELTKGFFLVVKDNLMFTALLPVLSKRIPCYAVVRNPLSVVVSARSTERPTGRATEIYAPELAARLKDMHDPIWRELARLDFSFGVYSEHLPPERVLYYEQIVGSGGKALKAIVPSAGLLDEPLESRNLNPLYDRDDMLRVGERLLSSEGAYWRFYSRESVEDLLSAL